MIVESSEKPDQNANEQLKQRIHDLIETQQLYKQSDLKVADIANALGTNSRYVSECINSEGISFSKLINHHRIEYAKRLLRERPDMKLSSIWAEAGFASEQSFHRIFKQDTGLTPTEWKATMDKNR